MSRIRILGASLIVTMSGIGAAAAADIAPTPPPPASPVYNPAPAFSWSGPELGLIGGYGWGNAKTGGTSFSADGFTGGAYAGYNFQPGSNFVVGVEGDVTGNGMKGSGGGLTVSNPWGGTVRARAGLAFDRILLYATGGLAYGDVKVSGGGASDTNFRTGWTAGGGVEAALTNNVTARIEYRYTDLGSSSFSTAPSNVGFTSNSVLAGVGVKF